MDTAKNIKAITKVNLNTMLSSPRLENEALFPPQTRPKPVPLTCSKTKPDNKIPDMIWIINSNVCIALIIHETYLLSQFTNPAITEIRREKAKYAPIGELIVMGGRSR